MTKTQLKFEKFFYQIVIEGSTIICIADEDGARKYVEEKMKGVHFAVLPVPVFSFKGGRDI